MQKLSDALNNLPQPAAAGEDGTPAYDCPSCGNTGYFRYNVPVEHKYFGKLFPCDNPRCPKAREINERRFANLTRGLKLPKKLQGMTLERWAALSSEDMEGKREAFRAAVAFVEQPGHVVDLVPIFQDLGKNWPEYLDDTPKNSLVFFGPVGTGKTSLAVAIVNELLMRWEKTVFIRARDLVRMVQDAYSRDKKVIATIEEGGIVGGPAPTATQILRKFQRAPLLVVDEFDLWNVTTDRLEIVEEILRARAGDELPTVATCNLTQEQFLQKWQQRSADVLFEAAHWLPVAGVKLRRTNPAIK